MGEREKQEFIRTFAEKIKVGEAGVFVGAGVSRDAGFPSWKGLVKKIAKEIKLRLQPNMNLSAVVQYFLEERNKTALSNILTAKLAPGSEERLPRTLLALADLPLREIWTTNYDVLIEDSWRRKFKTTEPIHTSQKLSADREGADTIVYKMHGCITAAKDVTISKEHFELYQKEKKGFLSVLTGQYIERTFLFLGLSFTDPNFLHLFAEIKRTCGEDLPTHYAIIRKPKLGILPSDDAPKKKRKKQRYRDKLDEQRHWKKDLDVQYGIKCLEVDDWEGVVDIIKKIGEHLPKASSTLSIYQKKRILIIDDPRTSNVEISNHLRALHMLFGGIHFRIAENLRDADAELESFAPNVVIVNPKMCQISESVDWVKGAIAKADENNKRFVWGVIHDRSWSSEDEAYILQKSKRMRNFYTVDLTGDDSGSRDAIANFLNLCQVDFTLNFLDDTVTAIIEEFSGHEMNDVHVSKFAEKAANTIARLNNKQT